MNVPASPDSGLLSPVRAGTPVEAAVGDSAWLQAMLDAEAALARAQARIGVLPEAAAKAITVAARADGIDLTAVARGARETANPVVGLVAALTDAVAAHDPTAAEYVHRGSTSQDVFDTAAMLVAHRALGLMHADLARAAQLLASLAVRHRDTAMAGRTLALHAVPTTFGLKAAGWRSLILDALERITRLRSHGLPFALGGAAGTLAGYVQYACLDRTGTQDSFDRKNFLGRFLDAYAEETGLSVPSLPWHALRTPIADLAAALSFTTGALGKIAVDVQCLARTEVAEVAEPRAAGRGASSAMPHKSNPVLATLMRSAALQVPVMAAGLTQCLAAEDERSAGAWHAEWQLLRECMRLAGGATHTAVELIEGIEVHPKQMRTNLDLTGGQIVSERIAAVLAPRLGKRAARRLLTEASQEAHRTGLPLQTVLAGLPELSQVLPVHELPGLFDPTRYTGLADVLVDAAVEAPVEAPRTPGTSVRNTDGGQTGPGR
ncbi:3-carboxy-cis,cis-muconate cycloisomerase [Streptomyces pluripotens]|uniref:3-carboxy-cis,cis-muconate cycloisomerase n=1 Tax=Streptomyces pluripotens TaxID=1355015 RepID=A0A221P5R6_9ACTN|nr:MULTISPECIES: 3-carboxy-cis,cis-muconate cycloisomerase [Streptomyces]ARP73352.1 3-carboxy-cis,cis-muconate cycloisomerase [Streptomyces pluripotens]ASN27601.1 3-carboxy-cis,cis-muconate cycloisomerase [Streptomyces pluripotens]MCH0560277.1 3-carboxy-cis,cis-muconate cycloisomerase [Streptomyces sp. MUM 16J]